MRVALIYGGRAREHEGSGGSARSVAQAIDPARYDLLPIRIGHDGDWTLSDPAQELPRDGSKRILPSADPSRPGLIEVSAAQAGALSQIHDVDVVFPVVHGTY